MNVSDLVQFKLPSWPISRCGRIVEEILIEGLPPTYVVECVGPIFGRRPIRFTVRVEDILFVRQR